ncbi:hypothetical protein B0H13DRAFT_2306853 [Mycena leptocephala]|nr:hypothetical protein B0H13DRAFT_2306853 [Mycena leptocephala]
MTPVFPTDAYHRFIIAALVPTALHPTPPHSATAMRPGLQFSALTPLPRLGLSDLGILVRRRLIPCISAFLTAFILPPTSSHPSHLHYIYLFVVSPVPVPAPRPSRLRLQNDRNPASHPGPSLPPGSSDVPRHAVPHSTALYATNTSALSPSRSSRSALTPYLSALFLDPSLHYLSPSPSVR